MDPEHNWQQRIGFRWQLIADDKVRIVMILRHFIVEYLWCKHIQGEAIFVVNTGLRASGVIVCRLLDLIH